MPKTPRGGISAFQQLTIDDFDNIQDTQLRGVDIQTGEYEGTTYYLVNNADQLKVACGGQSGEKFVLLSDIDLSGVEWDYYENLSTIDGNGHTISNYHSDTGNSALVEYNYGTIKNLSMENCSAPGDCSAILCNSNQYGATISNCYVTDSTASGEYSAILCCYNNGGIITDCYVTDSTVSGTGSAILCRYNDYANIINTYALNITADEGMKYIRGNDIDEYYTVANNYQNHNENDTDATYKATEWFATSAAADALGDAFEYIEGKDHPTLLWENQPVPPTPPSGEKMRIQVGEDASASSFIEIDLGFNLGTLSIDLSTTEGAVKAIEDIDKLLTVLNNKQSEIGAVFNRLESVAMSNTMGVENMSAGLSTIVDADIAKLNSEYVKNQILQNASSALMVQASNLNREVVLGLLRNL